jgi:Protein of unknown function (DUF2510)
MTVEYAPPVGPRQTPPGWYPAVSPGLVRYWDGTQWTSHVAPATPPVPTQQPQSKELSTAGKVAMCGGVAALGGSFLPWVSIVSIFGKIEISGFDGGDGKLTAAAAVVIGILGYAGLTNGKRPMVVLAILAAIGGGFVSIFDWNNVQSRIGGSDSAGVAASVGYGLYLCTAGFIVCVVGLLSAMPQQDGKWQTVLQK